MLDFGLAGVSLDVSVGGVAVLLGILEDPGPRAGLAIPSSLWIVWANLRASSPSISAIVRTSGSTSSI